MKNTQGDNHRIVIVPQPVVTGSELPSNRLLTVAVQEDEDVEWTWSSLPNGQQYVSGYTIVKKPKTDD